MAGPIAGRTDFLGARRRHRLDGYAMVLGLGLSPYTLPYPAAFIGRRNGSIFNFLLLSVIYRFFSSRVALTVFCSWLIPLLFLSILWFRGCLGAKMDTGLER